MAKLVDATDLKRTYRDQVQAETILHEIPGGAALFDWFGRVPRFHDAYLLEITLASKGTSLLRIHAFEATKEIDTKGHFVLDKHVVVTIVLEEVTRIDLHDFDLPGIIFDFEIVKVDDEFQLTWDGSYGVAGTLWTKRVRIALEAGKPQR